MGSPQGSRGAAEAVTRLDSKMFFEKISIEFKRKSGSSHTFYGSRDCNQPSTAFTS